MRITHARRLPSLVLCALLAACGRGDTDSPQTPGQAAQEAQAQYTILIGWDGTSPTVSEETTTVDRRGGPIVAWAGDDTIGERSWLVAFGGPTPFQNGRRTFSSAGQGNGSRQGPINSTAALGDQYKYWIWVTDDEGAWVPLDPRLRIVEE